MRRTACAPLLLAFAFTSLLWAKHHHASQPGESQFDYYVLSLSWAPTYCNDHPGDQSSECRMGQHKTFVLHGLWPQAADGPPPMSCGPASPVAASLVDYMLQYFPSRGLIQHEWQEHGTCSGLSAQDYFHHAEAAFKRVQVPGQLASLNHPQQFRVKDLEQAFADSSRAPVQAVRISCHAGNLVNLEVCMSKDLQFQACTGSVRECPADSISLLPPR